MAVKVQIAGVSSLEEALEAERLGADALGFTLRLPNGIHDGLTEAKARSIIAALPPFISAVVITYADNAREVIELCRYVGATTVQLHGAFAAGDIELVRSGLPHLKIIRAVHVTGPEAVAKARAWERRADALILDTYDPESGKHGATGKTHDWSISRRIVEKARVPVILAGGLTAANIGEAIAAVRPWGVDVHTGVEAEDGTRDFAKLKSFIRAAKSAILVGAKESRGGGTEG